jgi:hypothetical protein
VPEGICFVHRVFAIEQARLCARRLNRRVRVSARQMQTICFRIIRNLRAL